MLDRTTRYPLLRGRRPIERRRRRVQQRLADLLTPRVLRALAAALLAAGVVTTAVVLVHRAARPDAPREIAESGAAMARGNYSAARNHALRALSVDPGSALANVALATADLALGDGGPAEGALGRAMAAGYPAAKLRAAQAHAALLQNDLPGALSAAARAGRDPYAIRIRALAVAAGGDAPAAEAQLVAALAADPDDAAAWAALGRVRYQAGDIAGATRAAVRAVKLRPAQLEGLVLAGEIVRDRYGLVAALPWFEAALRRDAFHHPALIDAAATLGELGRYPEMLEATRRALRTRPGSPQALYLQAVLAARAGQRELARAMLTRTEGQIGDLPGALLLGGALDFADDRPEQAIGAWSELLARQPMNLTARRLLGAAQLRAGDARGALATLRPIALRDDADGYTLALVARAFERIGERAWAARFLDRAAAPRAGVSAPFGEDTSLPVLAVAANDRPGNTGAAIEYLRGLIEAGRGVEALARARDVAQDRGGAPAARLLLGDILTTMRRPADALVFYRGAANLDFGAPTLLRLVEAAATVGQPRGAADALALYLAQNPRSDDARRLLANVQLAAHDWDGAVATLEAVRAAAGARDWVLLVQLAQGYAGAGDAPTAVRYARAAYRLQPASAATADAYAWALYGTNAVARALPLSAKAVALAPADPVARWHHAQLLAEAGRKDAARAEIARLLANPAFADRAAATALAGTL